MVVVVSRGGVTTCADRSHPRTSAKTSRAITSAISNGTSRRTGLSVDDDTAALAAPDAVVTPPGAAAAMASRWETSRSRTADALMPPRASSCRPITLITKGAAALSSTVADVRLMPNCRVSSSVRPPAPAPKSDPSSGPPIRTSPSIELPVNARGRSSSSVPSNLPCWKRLVSRDRPSSSCAVASMPASTAGAAPAKARAVTSGVSPVALARRSITSGVTYWRARSSREVLIGTIRSSGDVPTTVGACCRVTRAHATRSTDSKGGRDQCKPIAAAGMGAFPFRAICFGAASAASPT